MNRLLILRPQPGADETAARARALGLDPVVTPLFTVRPLPWAAPDLDEFEAVMLTSANAARHGGDQLRTLIDIPCAAVGEAPAAAAESAGFREIRVGPEDGVALLMTMEADGIATALHLCGADHLSFEPAEIRIRRIPVYKAEAVAGLPEAAEAALESNAVALLHSPRAARLFAGLVRDRSRIGVVAISARTARAAGEGWRTLAVAPRPRDEALRELAAKLCQTDAR